MNSNRNYNCFSHDFVNPDARLNYIGRQKDKVITANCPKVHDLNAQIKLSPNNLGLASSKAHLNQNLGTVPIGNISGPVSNVMQVAKIYVTGSWVQYTTPVITNGFAKVPINNDYMEGN